MAHYGFELIFRLTLPVYVHTFQVQKSAKTILWDISLLGKWGNMIEIYTIMNGLAGGCSLSRSTRTRGHPIRLTNGTNKNKYFAQHVTNLLSVHPIYIILGLFL